jgi:hypothetical protein
MILLCWKVESRGWAFSGKIAMDGQRALAYVARPSANLPMQASLVEQPPEMLTFGPEW